jgi:hypothetical protein
MQFPNHSPSVKKSACSVCRRLKKLCQGGLGVPCERCERVGAVCSNTEAFKDAVSNDLMEIRSSGGTATGSEGSMELSEVPVSLSLVAPLPPDEILNLVAGRYLTDLYDTFPISVRPPLVQELGRTAKIPDFSTVAIFLWTARWDPLLPGLIGAENRTALMKLLFDRLKDSLIPALDCVLAGYDAVVGSRTNTAQANSKAYVSLAVWILQTLAHVLATIISVPATDRAGSENFRDLMRIAAEVAKAARIADEALYGERLLGPWDESTNRFRTAHYSTLIERGRRAWWFIVSMDNFFATLHGTDPVINWHDFTGIKMPASDAACGVLTGDVGDPVFAALPSDWSEGGGRFLPPGSITVFQSLDEWAMRPGIGWKPVLTTCILPDGAFNQFTAVLLVSDLQAQISSFRRNRANPWTPHPIRSDLLDRLTAWYAELPPVVRSVVALLDGSPRPIPANVAVLAHLNLLYHSAIIALHAPSEEMLWMGGSDAGWMSSEAAVEAKRSAVEVSVILKPLVEPGIGVSDLGLPIFQYGVILSGLIHLIFLRNLALTEFDKRRELRTVLGVHAEALRKGQAALGIGERRSWWYERWIGIRGWS